MLAEPRFEWDERKNALNRRKHGVSFEEARSAFSDEKALLLADPDHATAEARFVLIGIGGGFRELVVVHCHRKEDVVIRIISARKATPSEREQYHGRRKR